MANIYDYQGNIIDIGGSGSIDYDRTVKAVAHRGFSTEAPENTLPAYKLAKEKGFFYVETDVSFTSDGVAVCLHDATINRTSNGSGNINELTWPQLQQYDFGLWKSSKYAGTKIPSFEQFIRLCKNIGLHPYIELKDAATYSEAQIQGLVDKVKSLGMEEKVTWISFQPNYLAYVKNYDAKARLGYVVNSVTSTIISTAQGLKTETNEVFIDSYINSASSTAVTLCINGDLPLEVWTVDNTSTITSMNSYITGVTSNKLIAGQVLYNANIN